MSMVRNCDQWSPRHEELRDLLRVCRARLDPASLDISDEGQQRRGPGVSQGEVASKLKLSLRRYQDFENGRAVPSPEQLGHIADTLAMTPPERASLYALAGGQRLVPPFPTASALTGDVATLVEDQDPHPAIVMDPAWDYLAWNTAWARWFHDPAEQSAEARNALLWIFSTGADRRYEDVAALRENALGRFRAAYARYPETPEFTEVLLRLRPSFDARRLWERHIVRDPSTPIIRRIRHPATGEVCRVPIVSSEFPNGALLVVFQTPDAPPARTAGPDGPTSHPRA